MIRQPKCTVLAVMLVAVAPTVSHAQLDAPVQWQSFERPEPLNEERLERFLVSWEAEQRAERARWEEQAAYRALSPEDQERHDQKAAREAEAREIEGAAKERQREEARAAKERQRETCLASLQSDMIAAQSRMQQRIMALAQAGDPDPAGKAGQEMQTAMTALMDKCGSEDESDDATVDGRIVEWLCAYVGIRAELPAARAGALILADEREVSLLEARLPKLQRLCSA